MPERAPGLDLLRATAILLVLVSHAALITEGVGLPVALARQAGPLGVDLFFALSGFLIGGILIDTGDRLRNRRVVAGFWLSRWLRTLPNYLLFFAVNLGLWAWVYRSHRVPWHQASRSLLFCQNLTHAPGAFFVESWSLSVEEWFYLLLPAGLWLALVCRVRFRVALAGCLAVMFVEPLARRWSLPVPRDWGLDVNMVVLDKFDAVACGVLASWVARALPAVWRRYAWMFALAGGGLLLECTVYALRPGFDQQWMARTLFPLVQPLGCAMLLPLAAEWCRPAGPWLGTVISMGARWSYSLYLVNLSVCALVVTRLQPQLGTSRDAMLACIAVYLGVSITVAAVVYRYFEHPILRWRGRIAVCREAAAARRFTAAVVAAPQFPAPGAHAATPALTE